MMAQNEEAARLAVDCVAPFSGLMVMVSSASVYRQYGLLLRIENASISTAPASETAPLRSRLYPYRQKQPRAADDPARWKDEFDKIPAESVFLSNKQIGACIVRLPMVYGPGDVDHRVERYVRLMRSNAEICLPESVAAWRNARGYVENIAKAIALAATAGRSGSIYNVAEPGDLAEREWIQEIARAVGWSGRVTSVPDGDPAGILPLDELPAHAHFAQHLCLDTLRIRAELGYSEEVPLDVALARTVDAIAA
jgi:nucleoside-diphosphate-sugar epimerase